jgi:cytochrome c553
MKKGAVSAIAASAYFAATLASAQNSAVPPAELSKAIAGCHTCHGPEGNSASTTVPRLNGQQAGYIAAQLRNFRNPAKEDPHAINTMWNVAEHTGDEMILALASYYAGQAPTEPRKGSGALAAEGEGLYMRGSSGENIPACQTCHGARGEGTDATPRLAGQHADYLTKELEVLRLSLRESDVMHPKTNLMTDGQIKALVAYLAND